MSEAKIAMAVVVLFSALTVVADVLIKKAADQNHLGSIFFAGGALIYGLSAFGWFYALRTMKLATLGGIYSLSTVVMIALAGIIFFGEKLTLLESAVLFIAVLAIAVFWKSL